MPSTYCVQDMCNVTSPIGPYYASMRCEDLCTRWPKSFQPTKLLQRMTRAIISMLDMLVIWWFQRLRHHGPPIRMMDIILLNWDTPIATVIFVHYSQLLNLIIWKPQSKYQKQFEGPCILLRHSSRPDNILLSSVLNMTIHWIVLAFTSTSLRISVQALGSSIRLKRITLVIQSSLLSTTSAANLFL